MKALIPYFAVGRLMTEPEYCETCDKRNPTIIKVECEVFYPINQVTDTHVIHVCEDCWPQYQAYFQKIKDCWDSVNHLWPDAGRRWVEHDYELMFNNVDWDVTFPLELIPLIRDARHCFLFGMYSASIISISSAVELALNLDTEIGTTTWKNLNIQLLKRAKEKGIDISDLLDEGECLEKIEKPQFLVRRNKFSHYFP